MASTLHLLESDVMNAWNYWSDEGVIRFIPIDNMNNYSIEFIDLTDEAVKSKEEINLLDELTNTSTKDMLKEIEKLVSRPLASKEMATYISWQKDFSFTLSLFYYLSNTVYPKESLTIDI